MEKIISYLKTHVWARERKNKDVAILNILAENPKYLSFMKGLPSKLLVDFVHDYTSYDRCWRKVLEENESLRGKDYYEKAALEEKKLKQLGYPVKSTLF